MRNWVSGILAAALLAGGATPAIAQQNRTRPASPASASLALPPELQGLDAIVGNATTVVFGEDSHGMYEVHRIVPVMFRYLVEQKGFRVFVFEAQWGLAEGLQDFMDSDRTALGPIESYWVNGAFASQPIADMLVSIRNWNRARPHDPIRIVGYQPEQPVTDFRNLFTHLSAIAMGDVARLRQAVAPCRAADAGAFPSELEFLTFNSRRLRQDRQPSYTDEERAACLAGLDEIEAVLTRLEGQDRSRAAERARLALHSLRNYVGVLRRIFDTGAMNPDMPPAEQLALQGEAYGLGDAARYRIYRSIKQSDFPDARIFHWMHNWHAFRHASRVGPGTSAGLTIPTGTVSIGEHIANEEGRAVVTIGNIVPCGDTCTEPPGSLEPAFAAAFGDTPALIDLHRDPRARTLPVAQPGTLYANHHEGGFSDVVLRDQLDAVLYIPRTQTTRNR